MGATVLITDAPWGSTEIEEEVLSGVGAKVVRAQRGDEEELVRLAPDADAILTCFARVGPAVVDAARRLQVIGRYGVGTDNIAVAEATKRGILVTNVPVYCTEEVVEHALGLLLGLARSINVYDRAVRAGDWSLAVGAPMRRVAGRTLGVVGFGEIGGELARRARALGLRVIVHSRRREPVETGGFEFCELLELAERADFVSLHVPLTADTRGMISAEFLERMGPEAVLINCARGGLVDHDALARALERGAIRGAAMDVFDPEPLPADHPLLRSERLIATPHVAYYSEESMRELARRAAENVAAVLGGRQPAATVNPELLETERWAGLTP